MFCGWHLKSFQIFGAQTIIPQKQLEMRYVRTCSAARRHDKCLVWSYSLGGDSWSCKLWICARISVSASMNSKKSAWKKQGRGNKYKKYCYEGVKYVTTLSSCSAIYCPSKSSKFETGGRSAESHQSNLLLHCRNCHSLPPSDIVLQKQHGQVSVARLQKPLRNAYTVAHCLSPAIVHSIMVSLMNNNA